MKEGSVAAIDVEKDSIAATIKLFEIESLTKIKLEITSFKKIIPIDAEKDNKKEVPKMEKGQNKIIKKAAKQTDSKGFILFFKKIPKVVANAIKQALNAEAQNPITATYENSNINKTAKENFAGQRNKFKIKIIKTDKMLICKPETANM